MATAGIALAMISVFVQSEVKLPRYVLLSMALNDQAALEDLRLTPAQRLRLEQAQSSTSDITPSERYQLTGVWRFQRQGALAVVRWFPSLSPAQQKRFSELSLRTAGLMPWLDDRAKDTFSLSDESMSKVAELLEKYNPYRLIPEPKFVAPKKNAPRATLYEYWEDRRRREGEHRQRMAFESQKLVYSIVQNLSEPDRSRVQEMYGRPYASRYISPAGSVRAVMLRDVSDPERLREIGTDPKYVRQAEAVRAVQRKSPIYTQRAMQRLTERRLQKLSNENVERLFQSAVQHAGPSALLLPEVVEALNLVPQQAESIYMVLLSCAGATSPADNARIESVLTPAQLQRWQQLAQTHLSVSTNPTRAIASL
ncbi:hypothetical protein MCEMSE15_01966 [Fimbriimonadaceae bacterium]